MPETQWYYAKDDRQYGPISAGELRELVAIGAVTPEDYLWRDGMDEWAPAMSVKGLFANELNAPVRSGLTPPTEISSGGGRESFGGETPVLGAPPPLQADATWFLTLSQGVLWGICILVSLVAGMRFAAAFISAKSLAEEQAACVVFATFCIASYIIARAGEKVACLIREAASHRKQ